MSYAYEGKVISALQAACIYGPNIEVIHELLKAGANVKKQNHDGDSALLFLLELKKIKLECMLALARLLLEAECYVSLHAGEATALFLSCKDDISFEIFTLIVSLGVGITTRNSEGMTVLHLCIH